MKPCREVDKSLKESLRGVSLLKTSKYFAWIFWIFEELSLSLWLSVSSYMTHYLTVLVFIENRTKRTQIMAENKWWIVDFMVTFLCGRWNAFFLFSEIISQFFFFFWRGAVTDANYSCQPSMIKTRQHFKDIPGFGCLSHTVRINRQYLASDFKRNNRIKAYCRKVSSLTLCSQNV